MFCTKCGAQVPEGNAFCTKCGNKVGTAPAQQPVAPQPAKEKIDIAEKLKSALGIDIDKRKIQLKEAIKAYGNYSVEIKLYTEVTATFIVKVSN